MKKISSTFLSLLVGITIVNSPIQVFSQVFEPFNMQFTPLIGKIIGSQRIMDPSELGVVLPHEHILIGFVDNLANLNDINTSVSELSFLPKDIGLFESLIPRTIIDVTTRGLRWECCNNNGTGYTPGGYHVSPPANYVSSDFPTRVASIVNAVNSNNLQQNCSTPLNLILSTGYYEKDWSSALIANKSINDLKSEMLNDMLSNGIDGSGLRAGVIGEIGISKDYNSILADDTTYSETKVLIAAARAQRASGVALSFHIEPGYHQVCFSAVQKVLDREGVSNHKVIIGHCHSGLANCPYDVGVDWYAECAREGYNVEFDLFNSFYQETGNYIEQLIDLGFADKILISQDICRNENLKANGGWGYNGILNNNFYGLFYNTIGTIVRDQIMINNPARIFAIEKTPMQVKNDFNIDGKTDVLWHNETTGQSSVWYMDGTNRLSYVDFASSLNIPISTGWKPVATGDFNLDGKVDILWHNETTGQSSVWYMDGTNRLSCVDFESSLNLPLSTGWKPVATGDFNLDGKVDILWHNETTGQSSVWYMDGTNRFSYVDFASSLNMPISTGWKPVATGDFNLDGKIDILWHNETTGQSSVWYMDGTNRLSSVDFTPSLNVPLSTGWKPVATSDFNLDGKIDILWHNATTGQTSIWYMNNLRRLNYCDFATNLNVPISTGWNIATN